MPINMQKISRRLQDVCDGVLERETRECKFVYIHCCLSQSREVQDSALKIHCVCVIREIIRPFDPKELFVHRSRCKSRRC